MTQCLKSKHSTELQFKIRQSIAAGIQALINMKNDDGSFANYRRSDANNWLSIYPLFSTLSILLAVSEQLPQSVSQKSVEWILKERRTDGSWIYDPDFDIPPDSDVTACAIAVLKLLAPQHLNIDSDSALLYQFWRKPNGPFITWLSDQEKWLIADRDDAVVNANILFALKCLGKTIRPKEVYAILNLIHNTATTPRYYCTSETIAYAAVRAGIPLCFLPKPLSVRPDKSKGVLSMAQWLSYTESIQTTAINFILNSQLHDGSWPIEDWCTGEGIPYYWGSNAITTAICIQALCQQEKMIQISYIKSVKNQLNV